MPDQPHHECIQNIHPWTEPSDWCYKRKSYTPGNALCGIVLFFAWFVLWQCIILWSDGYSLVWNLRHYATFKVRKFESLFRKISKCLQKTTSCIGLRLEQIFSVNTNIHVFSILRLAFAILLLCYFQKLQLLVEKNIWTDFGCILLLFVWSQKVCLSFLKSYFKLEILTFLSFVMSLCRHV